METDPPHLRLYSWGQTRTAFETSHRGRMVKCAALGAMLRSMGSRDLAQARRYTSGRADLSLGAGQQENVGEGIENEAEPKPSPGTVAYVQSTVRADSSKHKSEQD